MVSNKLKNITPSYTIGISSKVAKLQEKGLDISNLSIGEPDFNVPTKAKDVAINALNNNKTKYDSVSGVNELRHEIIKKLKSENNVDYDLDEIVVSSGAKHAITNTLISILNPGDEVLVPKPYWVSYPEMIKLCSGMPVFVDTDKKNNFKISVSDIKKHITPKTKMLFISNPSNPTGAIYTREELENIVDICIKNNIYILADEIYEKISYEGNFISIASLSNEAKDITITINGFSKSAAMTGMRVGYSASNKIIAKGISTVQGHLVSHPSTISQWCAYGALKYCSDDIDDMVKIYKQKRDLAIDMLSKIDCIDYVYPEGAFYMFIDISSLKSKLNYKDSFSVEFCDKLLSNNNVAAVPGIAFGMDDYIRISYACSEDNLITGIKGIEEFVNSLL
ncbi:pyridoxal phosphate-dependent aminotransferase [Tepidibacter hydrothermalis]|uniref:Aminotransferase n=1 Tax=Tepidibacter hydrothermalis TaxID=3036126 RepID=A0ABY8EB00_9FIRM|nr:pyridoxal phosphate-dependent aminotransferase [Tepidibacter hydrothermalis]WFD10100.1 pyridoxal phosphate-dependent aminotransferase [Tepidibacter hydrothermalis]